MHNLQTAKDSTIKRSWVLGLLVLALTLGACGEAFSGSTEVREESFSVGTSPRLIVENENGAITVKVRSAGVIKVHATLRNPEELEYAVQADGDTVRVLAKSEGLRYFGFRNSPATDLVIEVPSNTVVETKSSNGKIELIGVSGPSVSHTSNGAIELRDVEGQFLASTSNGKIIVTQSRGAFDLKTSNGSISFDGELYPGGDNRLKTSNGSIDVTLAGAPSVKLDASTSNGKVVSSLQFNFFAIEDEHLEGTIGDGEASLRIETSNGSIKIH